MLPEKLEIEYDDESDSYIIVSSTQKERINKKQKLIIASVRFNKDAVELVRHHNCHKQLVEALENIRDEKYPSSKEVAIIALSITKKGE